MARIKMNKYARRTSLNKQRSRILPLVALIAVFLVLCFVVSVVVGILLGRRAEGVEVRKDFDFPSEPYRSGDKMVSPVDAYAYELGANVSPYIVQGVTDLSVCLRHADGSLAYTSEVGALYGACPAYGELSLVEEIDYLRERGGRVCAYFYVTSFETEDETLQRLYQAYEVALVEEMARCGVDNILLICPAVTDDNISELEHCVGLMSEAAGGTAVGVLVTPELLMLSEQNVYYAARLYEACDFLALDLRALDENADVVDEAESTSSEEEAKCELEQTLEALEYYIRAYSMRIVLSKENASLYDSVKEYGVSNIQIIGE